MSKNNTKALISLIVSLGNLIVACGFLVCLLCTGVSMFCFAAMETELEGVAPNTAAAQERGIWIEATAKKITAQCYLNGNTTYSDEANQDRKRVKYGIGESLTLTVAGKPSLIGEEEEITWQIKDKLGLVESAEVKDNLRGKEISIDLRDDVLKGGKIIVTAKTQFKTAKITLHVVFPERISAKHIPANGQAGTEATYPGNAVVVFTNNGLLVGASMSLRLTLLPLDVSFSGLKIVERDAKSPKAIRPIPPSKSIGGPHTVSGDFLNVSATHVICDDQVGTPSQNSNDLIKLIENGLEMPQEWEWICNWNVASAESNNPNQGLIGGKPYIQHFLFETIDHINGIFRAKVSKFGCSATRENTPYQSPITFE